MLDVQQSSLELWVYIKQVIQNNSPEGRFMPIDDDEMWEASPLEALTADNELMAYKHHGFWKCMDALRDKMVLDALWKSEKADWKSWE